MSLNASSSHPSHPSTASRPPADARESAELARMIEKNRDIINRGWEELAKLTRMLDTLDAREASIVRNDLKGPARPAVPAEAIS